MKKYLQEYRSHLFLIGLFVFLFHGAKLNSGRIGIDTENLMIYRRGFYGGWLYTGRHGLALLNYLLGNEEFNPYFAGFMTLLLFALAVAAFLLLWDWVSGERTSLWEWGLGGLLWISHPAMVELFYFSMISMEICIALGMTAFALYLSFRWEKERRFLFAAGSVGVLLLTFSTYQAFVPVYIFGTVALLFLQALREVSEGRPVTEKVLVKRVFSYCILFAVSFFLNMLITRLCFGTSDYLSSQIVWGNASFMDCLWNIAAHVCKAFTGVRSCFYSAGLGVLALFNLILLILYLKRECRGKKGVCTMLVFFYLALLTTPFMLTVLLGGQPPMRTQMVLPALTGFLGYLGIFFRRDRVTLEAGEQAGKLRQEIVFGCMIAVCLVTGMRQAKVTGSLYYTDSCRNEQDTALGYSMIERIEQANPEREAFPVFVIGGREFQGNNSCVMGEVIGRSFFNYDRDVEPVAFWSTKRALGFLHTLGADYESLPIERTKEAVECSLDMPAWPADGSVQIRNDIILIKLSENEE